MTYVREQTSAELAAHIRSLQKMDGWFDPLSDRLWQEVEALQAELAGLKTGYEAYERVNAELKAEAARFRGLIQEAADELRELKASVGFRGHTLTVLQRIDAAMGKGEQS